MASRLARFDHDAIARTKAYVDQVTLPDNSERARPAVERFSRAISAPCAAGAVGPAPGARPQHRRRVRAVPRKAPSRVASRRLNSGSEPETRQILRAAILGIEGHSCSRLHRASEFREPAEGKGRCSCKRSFPPETFRLHRRQPLPYRITEGLPVIQNRQSWWLPTLQGEFLRPFGSTLGMFWTCSLNVSALRCSNHVVRRPIGQGLNRARRLVTAA